MLTLSSPAPSHHGGFWFNVANLKHIQMVLKVRLTFLIVVQSASCIKKILLASTTCLFFAKGWVHHVNFLPFLCKLVDCVCISRPFPLFIRLPSLTLYSWKFSAQCCLVLFNDSSARCLLRLLPKHTVQVHFLIIPKILLVQFVLDL